MPDAGERQLSLLLTGLIPIVASPRPSAREVETAMTGNQTLENAARAALAIYAKTAGLAGPPDAERWHALHEALATGLAVEETQQLSATVRSLQAAFDRLAKEESMRWLALVPLESAVDLVQQPSYAFDTAGVRACVLPPVSGQPKFLVELAHQYGAAEFTLGKDIRSSSLALEVRGTAAKAADRALARFADVRDAARAAWLLANAKPRAPASSVELALRWVEVVLVGSSQQVVQPVRAMDIGIDVSGTALQHPSARSPYSQILPMLATPSGVVESRDGDNSPEARLTRSFRVAASSWIQASFDVRYLLYLVALETLIPAREDITEAVTDIGARLIATGIAEREAIAVQLRDAYNLRSRFVHDGELITPDTRTRSGLSVSELQEVVMRVWSTMARNYLPLAARGFTGAQLEAVLAEFRGKTVNRFSLGSPWADAVNQVAREI